MSELSDLYQEVVLQHGRAPRNFGDLPNANRRAEGHNPLCGDVIHLNLLVEDGVVKEARFEGAGCAISTASASLMTDAVRGHPLAEVERLFDAFRDVVAGEDDARRGELGKLEVLTGVRRFPVRVKCAMLPWRTLEAALASSPAAEGTTEPVSTE